jgi:hypothetical protein
MPLGDYFYDGSGARVKKITASERTIFFYNAMGKLVAEYSTQTASNLTISYLTSDNLGSPRVMMDQGEISSQSAKKSNADLSGKRQPKPYKFQKSLKKKASKLNHFGVR